MRARRLTALAAVCGLLSSCGLDSSFALPLDVLPGSIQAQPDLAGARVVVGSKDFTEQIILGHITEFALAAAGADVVDLTNIQGSNSSRQALLSGDTDVQWEYTGTAWISYFGETTPIPDERAQYEAVRDRDSANGLTWLDYAPLNNTYAFAVTRADAQRLGVTTVSQLAQVIREDPAQGVFCLETEFISRDDGFPGVQRAYDFQVPPANVKIFGAGAVYQALANGACTIGEVTSTDGRALALDLAVLADDRKFFPQYNAAPVVRDDFLAAHPGVRGVLAPVAERLDNPTMQRLSATVDVDGADPVEVARDWLVREGFIRLP